jgi:hypothetical protein
VVSGVLEEDTVEDTVDTGVVSTKQVARGGAVSFDAGHIHSVVNRGDVAATSVHVYSPPLRSMGWYRRSADGRLVLDRVEDTDPFSP